MRRPDRSEYLAFFVEPAVKRSVQRAALKHTGGNLSEYLREIVLEKVHEETLHD